MRLTRIHQATALTRPLARTLPWRDVALGATAGLALVVLIDRTGDGTPERLTAALRAGMIALALGAAPTLDDPTDTTTAATALPRPWRLALRIAVTMPAVALGWSALLGYAARQAAGPLPAAALTLELAALLAFALAVAAASRHRGTAAASALLIFAGVTRLELPPPLRLYSSLSDPTAWRTTHHRWAVVLTAALGMLLRAARDPAAQSSPSQKAAMAGERLLQRDRQGK
jgi:fluoroquinolone transport system permease protein